MIHWIFLALLPIGIHVVVFIWPHNYARFIKHPPFIPDIVKNTSVTKEFELIPGLFNEESLLKHGLDIICKICRVEFGDATGASHIQNNNLCNALYNQALDQLVEKHSAGEFISDNSLIINVVIGLEDDGQTLTAAENIEIFVAFVVDSLQKQFETLQSQFSLQFSVERQYHLNWKPWYVNSSVDGVYFVPGSAFGDEIPLDFITDIEQSRCRSQTRCLQKIFVLYFPSSAVASPPHSGAVIATNIDDKVECYAHSLIAAGDSSDSPGHVSTDIVLETVIDKLTHITAVNLHLGQSAGPEWKMRLARGVVRSWVDSIRVVLLNASDANCDSINGCRLRSLESWAGGSDQCALYAAVPPPHRSLRHQNESEDGVGRASLLSFGDGEEVSIGLGIHTSNVLQSWELDVLGSLQMKQVLGLVLQNMEAFYSIAINSRNIVVPYDDFKLYEKIGNSLVSMMADVDQTRVTPSMLDMCHQLLQASQMLLSNPHNIDVSRFPFDQRLAMVAPFWVPLLVPLIKGLGILAK